MEDISYNDNLIFMGETAFSQPVINIGRNPNNDLILNDPFIPDFLAIMVWKDNQWHINSLSDELQITVNKKTLRQGSIIIDSKAVIKAGPFRLNISTSRENVDINTYQVRNMEGSYQPEEGAGAENSSSLILKMLSEPGEVLPGDSIEYEFSVVNAGTLVANIQFQIQGIPQKWYTIVPPVLNLNEGQKGSIRVIIQPEHDPSSYAGMRMLHFVATSPNYQHQTSSVDTTLRILPFYEYHVGSYQPHTVSVSRAHPSGETVLPVRNLSNTPLELVMQTTDDAVQADFETTLPDGTAQGSNAVLSIKNGETVNVPLKIRPRKLPLVGFSQSQIHFSTNISRTDQPGGGQYASGIVKVSPMINGLMIILLILLLALAACFICQPRIFYFGVNQSDMVITNGLETVQMNWNVSIFAKTLTIYHDETSETVKKNDYLTVNPSVSTVYTLVSENFFSQLFHLTYEEEVKVLVVPDNPTINSFASDRYYIDSGDSISLNWSINANAETADITVNDQVSQLPPESYSLRQDSEIEQDSLFSMTAENVSGTEVRSFFVNVDDPEIVLDTFAVYVRPDGSAVPIGVAPAKTVTWSSLTPLLDTGAVKPAAIKKMPAADTMVIPDSSVGNDPSQEPSISSLAPDDFTPGPFIDVTAPTAVPTSAAPQSQEGIILPSVINAKDNEEALPPMDAPDSAGQAAEFTVKLVEAKRDLTQPTGYRVISYYPKYALQKNEQVMIEWVINGVRQIQITPLEKNTQYNSAYDFYAPQESVNVVITAGKGENEQAYSLPLIVAEGQEGDGEGKCAIKASATDLTHAGDVQLNWTSSGITRLQIVSSAKAQEASDNEEKEKKAEAEKQGKEYSSPANKAVDSKDGVLADYLPGIGQMNVSVAKDTTFTILGYGSGPEPICNGEVKIKVKGSDKLDLKYTIEHITDLDGVTQEFYHVGDRVKVWVKLSDWKKGVDPTGNFVISDGASVCTAVYPVVVCELPLTQAGHLTIKTTYSGDDNYGPKKSNGKITVLDKPVLDLKISKVLDPDGQEQNSFVKGTKVTVVTPVFDWESEHIPTGKVTISDGTSSCEATLVKTEDETTHSVTVSGSCALALTKEGDQIITATYDGGGYYEKATAEKIVKVTQLPDLSIEITEVRNKDKGTVSDTFKVRDKILVTAPLTGYETFGIEPTGDTTISDGMSSCTATFPNKTCELTLNMSGDLTLTATYGGDDNYQKVSATKEISVATHSPLTLKITKTADSGDAAKTTFKLEDTMKTVTDFNPVDDDEKAKPTGTIKIIDVTNEADEKELCVISVADFGSDLSCSKKLEQSGKRKIVARYSGDENFAKVESDPVEIIVEEKEKVKLQIDKIYYYKDDANHDQSPYVVGYPLTVEFSLLGASSDPKPTGTITVTNKQTQVQTQCTIDPLPRSGRYTAKCIELQNEKIGDKIELQAEYSGDDNYLQAKDAATIEVTPPSATLKIIATRNIKDHNETVPDFAKPDEKDFILGTDIWVTVRLLNWDGKEEIAKTVVLDAGKNTHAEKELTDCTKANDGKSWTCNIKLHLNNRNSNIPLEAALYDTSKYDDRILGYDVKTISVKDKVLPKLAISGVTHNSEQSSPYNYGDNFYVFLDYQDYDLFPWEQEFGFQLTVRTENQYASCTHIPLTRNWTCGPLSYSSPQPYDKAVITAYSDATEHYERIAVRTEIAFGTNRYIDLKIDDIVDEQNGRFEPTGYYVVRGHDAKVVFSIRSLYGSLYSQTGDIVVSLEGSTSKCSVPFGALGTGNSCSCVLPGLDSSTDQASVKVELVDSEYNTLPTYETVHLVDRQPTELEFVQIQNMTDGGADSPYTRSDDFNFRLKLSESKRIATPNGDITLTNTADNSTTSCTFDTGQDVGGGVFQQEYICEHVKVNSTGRITFHAEYPGDTNYMSSERDQTIVVDNPDLILAITGIADDTTEETNIFFKNTNATVSIVLAGDTARTGAPAGPVVITNGSQSCEITSLDAQGRGSCDLVMDTVGDDIMIYASYEGTDYIAPRASEQVSVVELPKAIITFDTVRPAVAGPEPDLIRLGKKVIVEGTLTGVVPDKMPSGGTLKLSTNYNDTVSCSITDTPTGKFECSPIEMNHTGYVKFTITYSGDEHYSPTSAEKDVEVKPKITLMFNFNEMVNSDGVPQKIFVQGQPFTPRVRISNWPLSEELPEADGSATLMISMGDQSCEAHVTQKTEADGPQYECDITFTAPNINGSTNISLKYAGDSNYAEYAATGKVYSTNPIPTTLNITEYTLSRDGSGTVIDPVDGKYTVDIKATVAYTPPSGIEPELSGTFSLRAGQDSCQHDITSGEISGSACSADSISFENNQLTVKKLVFSESQSSTPTQLIVEFIPAVLVQSGNKDYSLFISSSDTREKPQTLPEITFTVTDATDSNYITREGTLDNVAAVFAKTNDRTKTIHYRFDNIATSILPESAYYTEPGSNTRKTMTVGENGSGDITISTDGLTPFRSYDVTVGSDRDRTYDSASTTQQVWIMDPLPVEIKVDKSSVSIGSGGYGEHNMLKISELKFHLDYDHKFPDKIGYAPAGKIYIRGGNGSPVACCDLKPDSVDQEPACYTDELILEHLIGQISISGDTVTIKNGSVPDCDRLSIVYKEDESGLFADSSALTLTYNSESLHPDIQTIGTSDMHILTSDEYPLGIFSKQTSSVYFDYIPETINGQPYFGSFNGLFYYRFGLADSEYIRIDVDEFSKVRHREEAVPSGNQWTLIESEHELQSKELTACFKYTHDLSIDPYPEFELCKKAYTVPKIYRQAQVDTTESGAMTYLYVTLNADRNNADDRLLDDIGAGFYYDTRYDVTLKTCGSDTPHHVIYSPVTGEFSGETSILDSSNSYGQSGTMYLRFTEPVCGGEIAFNIDQREYFQKSGATSYSLPNRQADSASASSVSISVSLNESEAGND